MVEKVLHNLFRIEIPLPESPLKSLNSYVIKAPERNLIIDTGLNRKECLRAMQTGLRELGVDLEKTDFFITHLHADHFGLVSKLVTDTRNLAACGGTFLTGLPRLTRFSYFLYILNIPSILSKKWDFLYYQGIL